MLVVVVIPYNLEKFDTGAVTQPHGAATLPHVEYLQIIRYVEGCRTRRDAVESGGDGGEVSLNAR